MLYAYARIEGIRRKAKQALDSVDSVGDSVRDSVGEVARFEALQEKEEMALAKHLIRFEEVLAEVERDLFPHKVLKYFHTSYLLLLLLMAVISYYYYCYY
jgi:arginyl-tRNA synthetase